MSNATKKAQLDDIISQAEAARIRGVSIQAIANLIERGKLSAHEIGGRRFVLRSEVEAFMPQPLGRPPKSPIVTDANEKKAASKKKKAPTKGNS